MDVTEQKVPTVFSQMLQMFPNIPHEIVWLYVNRYSNDIETCTEMLNLQCGKYSDLQTFPLLSDLKNINEFNKELHLPPLVKPVKISCDFSNDPDVIQPAMLVNSEANDLINENIINNLQPVVQKEHSTSNFQIVNDSSSIPQLFMQENMPVTYSPPRNLNYPENFQEPLTLHINVDQEGDSLHSWRPNLSVGTLCSDFFMPSTTEELQFGNNQSSHLVYEQNISQIQMNPEGIEQEPWMCTGNPMEAFYGYLSQDRNIYGVDVGNHLRFQKSQMNAIRYEVIKAKIELSDLKDTVEKLQSELNEKMQSKSVQDIEKLNEEIIQLRLDCQSLCIDVDSSSKDQVLLGELDESCYKKSIPPQNVKDPVSERNYELSENGNYSDVLEEANKWQCPKCTFDNHPAINACEMCQLTRPCSRRPPYLKPPPDACYCHPKKETPVPS